MSFIKRELEKIEIALHEPRLAEKYQQLYAAQQALAWALEPKGFKAPYKMITGTPVSSEDCLSKLCLPQSLDMDAHCGKKL